MAQHLLIAILLAASCDMSTVKKNTGLISQPKETIYSARSEGYQSTSGKKEDVLEQTLWAYKNRFKEGFIQRKKYHHFEQPAKQKLERQVQQHFRPFVRRR